MAHSYHIKLPTPHNADAKGLAATRLRLSICSPGQMKSMHRYFRYALVGAATGMRATAGPLLSAWTNDGNPPRRRGAAFIGEVVCDKMPFVGSRIKPGPLLGRMAAAGYAAATLKDSDETSRLVPIAIAALCAATAAFACSRARVAIAQRTCVPDAALGVAEDALCVACMFAVVAG